MSADGPSFDRPSARGAQPDQGGPTTRRTGRGPPGVSGEDQARGGTERLPRPPIEPPVTRWSLPDPSEADHNGVAGVGADLEPGTVLAAYRSGLFPMHIRDDLLGWWSPDPRGVLPLDGLRVSRSLRRSMRRFEITVDNAFADVVRACAAQPRPHGWINEDIRHAYVRLHALGWAHSVEVWAGDTLAGGLYGVSVGGLFAGESMFHRRTDASKAALVHLVRRLTAGGATLLDVQWCTLHLASLGAVEIPRSAYLEQLRRAVAIEGATPFAADGTRTGRDGRTGAP